MVKRVNERVNERLTRLDGTNNKIAKTLDEISEQIKVS